MIDNKIKEDGFPGGIGIGLDLPGGYINGAPTGSVEESNNTNPSSKLKAEPHPTRHETEHPADEPNWFEKAYQHKSVSEILTAEEENEIFEEFLKNYFTITEVISESKEKSIKHFIEYATKRLKLKETPKVTLLSGNEYGNEKSSLGGYNPGTKEIFVSTDNRLTADILRTIAHEMVHRKQDELGLVKDEVKDGADGSPIENQAHAVAGILMREYGKINKQIYTEGLLLEGGAAGHLAHPFEDEDLTFNDMKEMINRGLIGGLDKEAPVSEKLDGQNIAFSVRDGKVVFGRNKGHVRDRGANALDVKGIYNQFKGRGGIETAFVGAAEDLQSAVKKLSPQQTKKMFGNGSKFMSLEIILPETQNVIPYGRSVLVMHGTITYDKNGEQIGRSTEDGKEFAEAVQKVGADRQKTFGIEGPKTIAFSDAESKEYVQKAKEFNSILTATAGKFGLSNKAKLGDYRRAWWMNEINNQEKKLGIKFSPSQKKGLVGRFADGDKSFGVKNFEEDAQRNWFRDFETNQLAKAQKQMIKPIEHVFLNAGAQSLKRVTNFLSSNNPGAANALRKETLQSIKGIKDSKDVDKIAKLQVELERLENIGMDKIVPSEGVVFQYNGKPYKFTGLFAPINQIQGTFKFDKPKKKEAAAIEKEQPKEEDNKNTIAIFSGRFQPFHAGHYSIYKSLVDKFGAKNVYIATSNITDPVKSPFPFKDKKNIMNKMFSIPLNKIVKVKNPYAPVEILEKFPPDTTYVTAVSQKDSERLEKYGDYFNNFDKIPANKRKGYGDHGYFIVAPEMELKVNRKNISGTQLRATFGSDKLSTPEKKQIFKQVYPKFDSGVFSNIVATTKKAELAKNGKKSKTKPATQTKKPTDLKSKIKSLDPKTQKRVQKVLQTKIKNPETGNLILVKSALRYDNTTRVKKLAVSLVKQVMR